jgi:hypothetical protein
MKLSFIILTICLIKWLVNMLAKKLGWDDTYDSENLNS